MIGLVFFMALILLYLGVNTKETEYPMPTFNKVYVSIDGRSYEVIADCEGWHFGGQIFKKSINEVKKFIEKSY